MPLYLGVADAVLVTILAQWQAKQRTQKQSKPDEKGNKPPLHSNSSNPDGPSNPESSPSDEGDKRQIDHGGKGEGEAEENGNDTGGATSANDASGSGPADAKVREKPTRKSAPSLSADDLLLLFIYTFIRAPHQVSHHRIRP